MKDVENMRSLETPTGMVWGRMSGYVRNGSNGCWVPAANVDVVVYTSVVQDKISEHVCTLYRKTISIVCP